MNGRVLLYDVECAPITAHIWGLRDLNVGINQIVKDPELLGVGFKWWHSGKKARYHSVNRIGRQAVLEQTRDLFDQADVVVGFNSVGFDNKWVNGELARAGMTPASPFKNIDLYRVVQSNFRWPSYKLQYVCQSLGIGSKLETGGHDLWVKVMAGDPKADARMGRYCSQDVELLEPLLDKLLPWLPATMNLSVLAGETGMVCPSCSSPNLQRRGYAVTTTRRYARYQCQKCGRWARGTTSESFDLPVQIQGEAR